MLRLERLEFRDHQIKRFVPACRLEQSVSLDQWMQQTIGVVYLKIGCNSLRTKTSFINGKIVTRFEADHVILLDQQIHPALHATIRTMRRHDFVDDAIRLPALIRCVVQMRAVSVDDLFEVFDSAHETISNKPLNRRGS